MNNEKARKNRTLDTVHSDLGELGKPKNCHYLLSLKKGKFGFFER